MTGKRNVPSKTCGRLRCLVLTSVGHFINDGTVFFVPLIAAVLAARPGVTPLDIAVMFAVFYSASAFLSTYVGAVADRMGSHGLLIGAGLALVSAGLLGFFAISDLSGSSLVAGMVVSALVTGFGSAFYHPLGAALIAASFGRDAQGRALGINGAAGSFGRALYPSLFFAVSIFLTGSAPFAVFAVIGLVAAAALWTGFRKYPSVASEDVTSGAGQRLVAAATRSIVILTLVAFVRSLSTQAIVAWIPIYISLQKGVGLTSTLGLTLTIMYAAAIVGQPLFGLLTDRFEKRWVLGLSTLGVSLSVLAYVSSTGIAGDLMLVLFGFFTFSSFPLLLSMVPDYVPRGSASSGNALVWGLGVTGGNVVGPLLAGAFILSDYSNLGSIFELMAGISVFAAVGSVLLPRAKSTKKVPLFG